MVSLYAKSHHTHRFWKSSMCSFCGMFATLSPPSPHHNHWCVPKKKKVPRRKYARVLFAPCAEVGRVTAQHASARTRIHEFPQQTLSSSQVSFAPWACDACGSHCGGPSRRRSEVWLKNKTATQMKDRRSEKKIKKLVVGTPVSLPSWNK